MRLGMLAAAFLSISTSAGLAEVVSMPPTQVGVWNDWRGGCMVEPFEGPKCGLEKRLAQQSAMTDAPMPWPGGPPAVSKPLLPDTRTRNLPLADASKLMMRPGRVWLTLDKGGAYISVQPTFSIIQPLPNSDGDEIVQMRVDGNDIWLLQRQSGAETVAMQGDKAKEIVQEMLNGKILYLRGVRFSAGSPYADEFDLKGFKEGYEAIAARFAELDHQFPSARKPAAPPEKPRPR